MISVVFPVYVPTEALAQMTWCCLDSLNASGLAYDHELVVVDNGSLPEVRERLDEASDVYLRYAEPLGYARAANIGLAVAQHDWLLVLNNDIEFCSEGGLAQFVRDYAETPGGILAADDEGRSGIVYDESWFSCWLTHRDVVRRVGYFDESLPYRFHDQDYAIRVHRAGYRVMRTGNVPVSHINSATYNTMGRGEDPPEREAMMRRWGASLYADWLRNGQSGPT